MKLLIISGASRGIGASIVEKFLQEGWRAMNLSRSPARHPQAEHIQVDFSQLQLLAEKFSAQHEILKKASQICLVHNAAHYEKDQIQAISPAAFEKTLRVNLMAPNILNQMCIPYMAKGSSIIYMGSTLAEKAVPGAASYIISKHALVGMMRATCQDLTAQGIHTCCISPGFTDTEMMRSHVGDSPEILQEIRQRVGANRLIHPKEIAALAWFCAHNPVIDGAVLNAYLGQIER